MHSICFSYYVPTNHCWGIQNISSQKHIKYCFNKMSGNISLSSLCCLWNVCSEDIYTLYWVSFRFGLENYSNILQYLLTTCCSARYRISWSYLINCENPSDCTLKTLFTHCSTRYQNLNSQYFPYILTQNVLTSYGKIFFLLFKYFIR